MGRRRISPMHSVVQSELSETDVLFPRYPLRRAKSLSSSWKNPKSLRVSIRGAISHTNKIDCWTLYFGTEESNAVSLLSIDILQVHSSERYLPEVLTLPRLHVNSAPHENGENGYGDMQ